MTELPDDKISADYQVANDLPLDSEVHVGCRSAGQVSSVNLTLLVRLDVSDRKVAVVRIAPSLREIRANGGQNLQCCSASE